MWTMKLDKEIIGYTSYSFRDDLSIKEVVDLEVRNQIFMYHHMLHHILGPPFS